MRSSRLRHEDVPRFNERRLIASTIAGQIANPILPASPYRIGRDGRLRILPGTGGIVLNRRIGDRATELAGDHVEPGVALRNNDRELAGTPGGPNRAFMTFACVGNSARVVNGPATGASGVVTGKHGGINHVLVDFPPQVLRRLRIGDRIQITACGQGLELLDFPNLRVLNSSPRLLAAWGIRRRGPILEVPVTHLVPARLMGSGFGRPEGVLGDCDIQLADEMTKRKFRLDQLRFGDLVAICGLDYRFGPSHQPAAMTIGVVVHSDSTVAGHGPGVTPLLISTRGELCPIFFGGANIAHLLGVRRSIAPLAAPGAGERPWWRRVASPARAPVALAW